MSDADRQFLMEMVPGLSTTPEGRKLMIGYLKRIHEYNIGMAKAVQKYRESADWRKNPVGLARVAHEYADANQIAFNEEDMQTILRLGRPQAQPIPTSPPPDPEASGRIKQKYGLD